MGIIIVAFVCLGVGWLVGGLVALNWNDSKRKLRAEIRNWRAEADSAHADWLGQWQRNASLKAELAAERAKKKCTNCRYIEELENTATFASYVERGFNLLTSDPEAERVAKLPKYGTTKKCPACGGNSFFRNVNVNQYKSYSESTAVPLEKIPAEHQYIIAGCNKCGWTVQERPLFNKGQDK